MPEKVFRFLDDLPPEKNLRIKSQKISNLHELSLALENMDEKTFKSLAKKRNNHIKNWVYSKVKDIELSQRLAGISNRSKAAAIVHNRVIQLQKSKYNYSCAFKRHALATLAEFGLGLFLGVMAGLIFARMLV